MERLSSRVASYFRWMRNANAAEETSSATTTTTTTTTATTGNILATVTEDEPSSVECQDHRGDEFAELERCPGTIGGCCSNTEASRRLCGILESILLWENSVNSISVVVVFNILFWGIIVLEVRGFAAASSAALVVVLCYSTLEAQVQREGNRAADPATSHAKAERIEEIGKRARSALDSLRQLRREQPGVFCTAVCSLSIGLWIIGRTVNGVLLAYAICMSVLLGPALLLKLPGKVISHKEWETEIEEFLPAVTEDNLQLLTRAGESGDPSPTPPSVNEPQNEFLTDEDLMGLRMPSHEESSTEGVEVSELELSEETDIDGIKFRSGHFEKGGSSSSEEEADLAPKARKMISHSDESGSEFEMIDSQEADSLNVA